MKRMNLKELKEALNELDDNILQEFAIAPDFSTNDASGKFSIIYKMPDKDEDKLRSLYDTEAYAEIEKGLLDYLNVDAINIAIAKLDDEQLESFCEDVEYDW